MKVVQRKLSSITPYWRNPRNNDESVAETAASIRDFGFKQPIVVDADGVIIVGHMWNGMAREGDRREELLRRIHPTQKPVGLFADILEDFSKEGATILDAFGGSGSVLIACEKVGRRCLMMDCEPYYVAVIVDRWEQYTGMKAEKVR